MIEDIHAYEGLGVSELIFDIRATSLAASLERIDHIGEEIMARAGG